MEKTEDILEDQITQCAAALKKCLANADAGVRQSSPYHRSGELEAAIRLMQASAGMATALARLRGHTLRVVRENDGSNRTGA